MTQAGSLSLLFSLFLSVLVFAGLFLGLRRKDGRFVEASYRAADGVFFFMSVAVGALLYAFLTDDFRVAYVAGYSERALPLFYKITGLWAGQNGSLLFWGWLIALFTFILVRKNEGKPGSRFLPYVLIFLNLTVLFFLVLVNFVTPPFELAARVPADGNGLNPLLQNPGMVFHPPTLYLGYVGFTVPFSFAMAALAMGELGDWWIKKTRAWTLFSWLFLTLGIVFGGWWAYRELGWGGVWGWDPVENSSLLPWFTSTAFLHSVMVQERRGMLKVWNLVLIILTYLLSIFGAFVTRSGIIQSVHAFGQSGVGYVFLAFLALVGILGVYLVATRYGKLKENNPKLESVVSRESSFLYNNLILIGLCFATLWGTVFPLVSEAVKGVKISVGPPFFNTVNSPMFLLLLLLMGLCPLLGWRGTSVRGTLKNLLIPSVPMALSLPLLYRVGVRSAMPLFFYAFSLFVVVSLAREFYIGTRARVKNAGEKWLRAFVTLLGRNRRRYGGYLVHAGIVLMALGLASYGYYQYKEEFTLSPGQEASVKEFNLRYVGLTSERERNYEGVSALVEVYRDGTLQRVLRPEKRFYQNGEPTTEVAIMQGPEKDLYLILSGWTPERSISMTVVVNPLLSWVWTGTGVAVLGVVWAMLPGARREEETVDAMVAEYLLRFQRSAGA
jgi:cytochrome c-type biogenesis protein CcmF